MIPIGIDKPPYLNPAPPTWPIECGLFVVRDRGETNGISIRPVIVSEWGAMLDSCLVHYLKYFSRIPCCCGH